MRSKKHTRYAFDRRGYWVWYDGHLEYQFGPQKESQKKKSARTIGPIILGLVATLVWLVVGLDVSAYLIRHLW
jgi:hypothetical protein